jgi:membrane associated rhomboid family serine protease
VLSLLGLLVFLGLVFAAMAPDARDRLRDGVEEAARTLRHDLARGRPEREQFRQSLRARARWALVTPGLVAVSVALFALMAAGPGALADPGTIVGWGGNYWLRTRNGEWWRVITSMFVHTGVLHLLVNVAGLAQIGLILERLVGRLIVLAVFLTAGVFANLVNLSTHLMATGVGASAAIFGLYGVLVAAAVWSIRHPAAPTIPFAVVKTLVPAAAVFVLYNLFDGSLGGAAELTGLLAGLVFGTLLIRAVSDGKPSERRLAWVSAAAVVVAVVSAIPLRGITDVQPELERTFTVEARTAADFRQAAERVKKGAADSDALVLLIDRTILPELDAAAARLTALDSVPEDHQPLVADAQEYARLRSESWRLRAGWLLKAGNVPRRGSEAAQYRDSNRAIALAEETERAALEALERVRLAGQRPTLAAPAALAP